MNPRRLILGLVFSLCALLSHAAPPDVNGNWKWNFERNGESREILMSLKQEGGKVAGTVKGPDDRQVEIREGTIAEDGKLTFLIHIERDGNTMKINFDGKASGDTISGKTFYINPQGEEREIQWNAAREKKRDLSGNWKSTFKRQDGTSMDSTLVLKHDGEKITGKNVSQFGESDIQDGRLQGSDVTFKIIRDRDGRTITSKYRGKLQEDNSIKGQIESDWSGEVRRMEWEAKKD